MSDHSDTAIFPESDITGGDQSIVWRLNEQLITHCRFADRKELVSTDPTR